MSFSQFPSLRPRVLGACAAAMVVGLGLTAHAQVTVQQALAYLPVQKDVEFDTPAAKDLAKCKVEDDEFGGVPSWIVRDGNGQILRSFGDTNNDKKVDQWCYFKNGIESYRDLDSNFNGRADQHRWMGISGTKWGIDRNEDGNIDSWKDISPEEVSSEITAAVRDGDVNRFATVLLKPTELAALGLGPEASKKIQERLQTAVKRFQTAASRQNLVGKGSKWVHFSASQPSVLPAGSDGATKDVYIYENVSAMLDKGQLPIGTFVRLNGQWRAIDVPTGLMPKPEINEFASFLLTPNVVNVGGGDKDPPPGVDKETQQLVARMTKNDEAIQVEKNAAKQDALYDDQVLILRKLANKGGDGQQMWIEQLAEMLSTSVQSGEYSKGKQELEGLSAQLEKQAAGSELAGYVKLRLIQAEYSEKLKNPKAAFGEVQAWWIKNLEAFVTVYKKGPEFTEATLQLGIAEELAGNDKVAVDHFETIVKSGEGDLPIAKAKGAIKRLTSVGRPLVYGGPSAIDPTKTVSTRQYNGKYVLVHFWATWCQPCMAEMRKIDRMRAAYGKDFAVIGVNVDTDAAAMKKYFGDNPPRWQHIHTPGGFDGKAATDLGILTVPTRMLLDRSGKVVKRAVGMVEADDYLDKKIFGKGAAGNAAAAAVRRPR